MSIVEDLKKALQDVLAPDVRATVEGLNALREEVKAVEARVERTSLERHTELLRAIDSAKKEVLLSVEVTNLTREVTALRERVKEQPQ